MKKIWSNLTLLSFTLPLFSLTEIKNEVTAPILTPSLSEQKTLKLRLDNGLEAIIISDPKTDKSGAVLTVRVGSWEDPLDHPGLAHFLEHMLFMGTKKYPEEGEYHRFIQDNSGQTNAFTANHITSYLFSINNNSFNEGLNRFSQFFKEPLFNPSGVSRELCAIDQEYEMNVQKSNVREYFVYKAISDPSHPLWRFNIGNSKTLKDVRRNELIDWYKQHYSANLMRLLVISPEPLDQLKEIVIKDFSDIQNNNKKAFTTSQRYTQPSMQGSMIIIEPIKDTRSLSIAWELPLEFVMMKDVKPEIIVCHILGHEGEESLLAQLKREGLADALSCGPLNSGAINRDLFIHITLTDKGLHEVNTVIQRVFQIINQFKQVGYSEQLFEEIHKIEKLNYQYQPRQNIFESLMTHGINIHNENIETYPEQTQIIQKYDSKSVLDLLNYLSPQNAIFFLTAPKGTTNYIPDKIEPWLGVAYSIEKIDPELLEEWKNASPHPNIYLPPSNPFLPNSLSLYERKKENEKKSNTLIPNPETIVNDDKIKIYYCLDEKFHEPKIYLSLEIKTPEVDQGDPLKTTMADLYVKFLTDKLKQYSYPAELAGLSYQIKQQNNGISIKILGFNDKAERLLTTILENMRTLEIDTETFKSNKQILSRKYQNFAKESPINLSIEILKKIINKQYSTHKEKAQAIRGLSLKKFQTYLNDLFKKTYTQGLLYGNIPEDNALQIVNTLNTIFNTESYPKNEQLFKEIIDLQNSQGPFYIEHSASVPGNAALLAIEFTPFSLKARSVQQILMQGMQEPFFSELRTKQQTGYAVSNMGQDVERHLFNIFIVQSVTNDPRDLLARFELFIETFLQNMEKEGLTEERFKQIQEATIKNLEVPANSLEEMGSLLETLAFEFNGDFMWIEKRIESLKNLTYPEFLTISKEMLGKGNRKRIGCLIKGIQIEDKVLYYRRITNVTEIKKLSNYTPAEENSVTPASNLIPENSLSFN